MRRRAGPCRSVMAPKRAMSYLGAATDMNSIPQQAVTNGYWNSENLRAQLAAASTLVVAKSRNPIFCLLPADGALAPDVGEGNHQDAHEHQDLADAEQRHPAGARRRRGVDGAGARQVAVAQRPRVEER